METLAVGDNVSGDEKKRFGLGRWDTGDAARRVVVYPVKETYS